MNREFYERDTAEVAKDLLGKIINYRNREGVTRGMIVETEAYYGENDPASRASRKKTNLNELMWEQGGLTLIYMIHAHWMLNVTTEGRDIPGAVLIRALEPVKGIGLMRKRRGFNDVKALTSGPGKLTQALGITKEEHGIDLTKSNKLYIQNSKLIDFDIGKSHRIGVTEDLKRELRFYIKENEFISR